MTTRRNFLSAAAAATGMVFCGCGLTRSAHAQPGRSIHLPVTVGGKHVRTIDVHSHCLFHEAVDMMGPDAAAIVPPINGNKNGEIWIAVDQRMKTMDSMAIDMEVLSINPFWYGKDRDLGEKVCSIQNDKLA